MAGEEAVAGEEEGGREEGDGRGSGRRQGKREVVGDNGGGLERENLKWEGEG